MKLLNTLVIVLFVCLSVQAQTLQPGLLSSAGGSGTSPNANLQWSVGEIIVQTFSKGSQQLTQGFHQNSMLITPVFETEHTSIRIEAFPNPSTEQLKLRIEGEIIPDMSYSLLNIYGQAKLGGRISNNLTLIELNTLPAQTYCLSILSNTGQQLAVFKIQKID